MNAFLRGMLRAFLFGLERHDGPASMTPEEQLEKAWRELDAATDWAEHRAISRRCRPRWVDEP